jgi:hypothetical protein
MGKDSSFVGGRYALELDGQLAGWAPQVSGGAAHAEVITETTGRKHIGAVRYDDIVLGCGAGMSKAFYDWVGDASNLSSGVHHKHGALLSCDFDGKLMSRLDWLDGLITAVSFPALDAASKDTAALTVKIAPGVTRSRQGDGSRVSLALNRPAIWLGANFRLSIDGLDEACKHVTRIEPISITRQLISEAAGDLRPSSNVIGRVSMGDLVVTLPEARAQKFYDWFEEFVTRGNNSGHMEKNGTLELLSPNLSSTLFSLKFSHLGIYSITAASKLPGAEIRKVTVKMYCEGIRFTAAAAATK